MEEGGAVAAAVLEKGPSFAEEGQKGERGQAKEATVTTETAVAAAAAVVVVDVRTANRDQTRQE